MEKEWNPNDYQGRRRDQVQLNYRILAFSIVVFWLYFMGILVYKFIILPGSAAAGAFTGYKLAQIISNVL